MTRQDIMRMMEEAGFVVMPKFHEFIDKFELFAALVQEHQWQGLTEDEIRLWHYAHTPNWYGFARAIESTLKEKNHGKKVKDCRARAEREERQS